MGSHIYTNLPVNVTVRLPHHQSCDNQGQEEFLAPSADKQSRNYDTECSNHHPSHIYIYIYYIYVYIYIHIYIYIYVYVYMCSVKANVDHQTLNIYIKIILQRFVDVLRWCSCSEVTWVSEMCLGSFQTFFFHFILRWPCNNFYKMQSQLTSI